jgi:predicted transglutaminase-like cysteine proteinase
MGRRTLLLLLALPVAAAAGEPPARPVSIGMLAPPPPSSLAFCRLHGGTCDGIPRATPMPDGKAVSTPVAWRDYCRRSKQDPACHR